MKNIPKKIYLRVMKADPTVDGSVNDFKDLIDGFITWGSEREYDSDIEYQLVVADAPDEDVDSIVSLWNSKEPLIGARKPNAQLKRIIKRRIAEYTLDGCFKAINNYSEVLLSKYYFKHRWSIKTFFTQSNAMPDFLDDGQHWINYSEASKITIASKHRPYSSASQEDIKTIHTLVTDFMVSLGERASEKMTISYMASGSADLVKKKQMALNSYLGKAYPVVFAYFCDSKGYFINEDINNPYNDKTFSTLFDNVIINSRGVKESSIIFKTEFNKLV